MTFRPAEHRDEPLPVIRRGEPLVCRCPDCPEPFEFVHPVHGGGRCLHLTCFIARLDRAA